MQQALGFLTTLHEDGCSYNQICTARSALSALITCDKNYTWGKLPIVQRFMKGVFERSPKLPKYFCTWDVKIVFNYFRSLEMPNKLSLKVLGAKLALLMVLVSGGQRSQTIHSLNIQDIQIVENKVIFPIMSNIKQTRPGKHMFPLEFKRYNANPKLCVVTHLLSYLEQTAALRTDTSLFISFIKPHKPISKDTRKVV